MNYIEKYVRIFYSRKIAVGAEFLTHKGHLFLVNGNSTFDDYQVSLMMHGEIFFIFGESPVANNEYFIFDELCCELSVTHDSEITLKSPYFVFPLFFHSFCLLLSFFFSFVNFQE